MNKLRLSAAPTSRIKQILLGLLTLAALLMGLALMGTYLARWAWIFELVSHLRVHLVVGLVGIAVLFLLFGQWSMAGVTALVGLIGFTSLAPFYFSSKWVGADQGAVVYRALALNVHYHNDAYDEVLALVEAVSPDFVVLSEATQPWRDGMLPLLSEYPYTHFVGYGKHGRIIYSRFPFVENGTGRVEDGERPSVVATLDLGVSQITIVGLHIRAPVKLEGAAQRNRQMASLAQFVQEQSQPIMLLGDFNITPWSPVFRDFLAEADLVDARLGHGLTPTWPTSLPLAGVPIDHAVVSPGIKIHDFQRGPHVGSDHFPIIVDFSLPAQ